MMNLRKTLLATTALLSLAAVTTPLAADTLTAKFEGFSGLKDSFSFDQNDLAAAAAAATPIVRSLLVLDWVSEDFVDNAPNIEKGWYVYVGIRFALLTSIMAAGSRMEGKKWKGWRDVVRLMFLVDSFISNSYIGHKGPAGYVKTIAALLFVPVRLLTEKSLSLKKLTSRDWLVLATLFADGLVSSTFELYKT